MRGHLTPGAATRATVGSVAGVFEVIVGAMRRHEGVAEVQRWACRALCQLVTCSGGTCAAKALRVVQRCYLALVLGPCVLACTCACCCVRLTCVVLLYRHVRVIAVPATATSGGFLAGLFGWLKASTETSAEVATGAADSPPFEHCSVVSSSHAWDAGCWPQLSATPLA